MLTASAPGLVHSYVCGFVGLWYARGTPMSSSSDSGMTGLALFVMSAGTRSRRNLIFASSMRHTKNHCLAVSTCRPSMFAQAIRLEYDHISNLRRSSTAMFSSPKRS
ncbi:hypothetical protein EJ03DRAFT_364985 [Teratosphaeria nubilosa]|uniref:Uncharacterized protein n=1 Tax=Teratosphaeria nubilosa TaxID=161662 RepID=A0A6G1L613_9PEZI|nr:hypothetical protein EJ03DRAFT_364985 [Teratosphaeria nubilosa]